MADEFRVRQALRAATGGSHERVDAIFSRFDLTDRAGYGRFLMAQAGAHLAVEAALEAGGIAALLDDWTARRRAPLIAQDLDELGLAAPHSDAAIAFDDAPALLGATYVLEGSRLGGALLKRSVPAHLPTRFLGAADTRGWRTLLDLLDRRIGTAEDVAAATNAARKTFMLFEQSGQRFLKAD